MRVSSRRSTCTHSDCTSGSCRGAVRNTILHGFATLGRAVEGLNKNLWAGDASRLKTIDVKFTKPLVLPARVGVYVRDGEVWIGDAAGGPAYMTGTFTTHSD